MTITSQRKNLLLNKLYCQRKLGIYNADIQRSRTLFLRWINGNISKYLLKW